MQPSTLTRFLLSDVTTARRTIVRRIFALCADGSGLTTIAKALNAQRAPCPRSQQGRPHGRRPPCGRSSTENSTPASSSGTARKNATSGATQATRARSGRMVARAGRSGSAPTWRRRQRRRRGRCRCGAGHGGAERRARVTGDVCGSLGLGIRCPRVPVDPPGDQRSARVGRYCNGRRFGSAPGLRSARGGSGCHTMDISTASDWGEGRS